MHFLRNLPITRKLTLITMLINGVALLITCLAIGAYEFTSYRRMLVDEVLTSAKIIADNSAAALQFDDPAAAELTLASLSTNDQIIAAFVYTEKGEIFGRYGKSAGNAKFPPPVQPNSYHFTGSYLDFFRDGFAHAYLELFEEISVGGQSNGTVCIRHSLTGLRDRIVNDLFIVLGVMIAASAVALLLTRKLQPLITGPIIDLARLAREVATKKNYSLRAIKCNDDEVGRLIDGFNEMLNQIQHRDSALQSAQDNLERRVAERTSELHSEVMERQRTEEERDRFFTLPTDLLCIAGMDGYFRRLNPAYETVLGFSIADLLQRPFLDVVHPDDHTIVTCEVEKLKAGISTASCEVRMRCKDSSYRWFDWAASPVPPLGIFYASGRDITERKNAEAELDVAHRQLLDVSRQAGMAEVATSVLHNVGNVLNSVNISCSVISEKIRNSRVTSVTKTAILLREHSTDLAAFFTTHPAGKKLPSFMGKLGERLLDEQSIILAELRSLSQNIEHIKDIVAMQQGYAKVSGLKETLNIIDLVEDSLRMNAGALTRHDVTPIREYGHVPPITVEKHKVLQILVNLIRNAKHACDESHQPAKQIRVRVSNGNEWVRIAVIDNGIGITRENLDRIFRHGFTTREDGHGFGLHSAVLAAQEMGGNLTAHSEGLGEGATFTLELPIRGPENGGRFTAPGRNL